MNTINEAKDYIEVKGGWVNISIPMLKKILDGDEAAIKRVKDSIEGSKIFNYGSKEEFIKPKTVNRKYSKEYAKAKKIIEIKMTGFYALLKNKLNIGDDDIKQRGDITDRPDSNFYVRTSIERENGKQYWEVDKKTADIECGKVRQVIGSSFKEGRGYWKVLLDNETFLHNGKKYFSIHCMFDYDKYIKEVILGKRFDQVSKKSIDTEYFAY